MLVGDKANGLYQF